MENSDVLHGKILQNLTALSKNLAKIACNMENFWKCQQRKTQIKFSKKWKLLHKCIQILNKIHQFKEVTPKKLQKNSIWRFLMTGVQLPDTSTDQAHMQLSRSYTIAYADSSSNGILWVFSQNFLIAKIDQSLGSIWHFPQKSSPKRTIMFVIFSGKKQKNARILFDHDFLFALVLELLLLPKKFSAFKKFLSLTNLFRILHCIEDWHRSQQIHVVAP